MIYLLRITVKPYAVTSCWTIPSRAFNLLAHVVLLGSLGETRHFLMSPHTGTVVAARRQAHPYHHLYNTMESPLRSSRYHVLCSSLLIKYMLDVMRLYLVMVLVISCCLIVLGLTIIYVNIHLLYQWLMLPSFLSFSRHSV